MRISDWSSDVCSSDLNRLQYLGDRAAAGNAPPHAGAKAGEAPDPLIARFAGRNETANRLTGRTRQRCGFENSSDRRRRLYRQPCRGRARRSEEHTSELQSLMRTSYAVFCLQKKKPQKMRGQESTT